MLALGPDLFGSTRSSGSVDLNKVNSVGSDTSNSNRLTQSFHSNSGNNNNKLTMNFDERDEDLFQFRNELISECRFTSNVLKTGLFSSKTTWNHGVAIFNSISITLHKMKDSKKELLYERKPVISIPLKSYRAVFFSVDNNVYNYSIVMNLYSDYTKLKHRISLKDSKSALEWARQLKNYCERVEMVPAMGEEEEMLLFDSESESSFNGSVNNSENKMRFYDGINVQPAKSTQKLLKTQKSIQTESSVNLTNIYCKFTDIDNTFKQYKFLLAGPTLQFYSLIDKAHLKNLDINLEQCVLQIDSSPVDIDNNSEANRQKNSTTTENSKEDITKKSNLESKNNNSSNDTFLNKHFYQPLNIVNFRKNWKLLVKIAVKPKQIGFWAHECAQRSKLNELIEIDEIFGEKAAALNSANNDNNKDSNLNKFIKKRNLYRSNTMPIKQSMSQQQSEKKPFDASKIPDKIIEKVRHKAEKHKNKVKRTNSVNQGTDAPKSTIVRNFSVDRLPSIDINIAEEELEISVQTSAQYRSRSNTNSSGAKKAGMSYSLKDRKKRKLNKNIRSSVSDSAFDNNNNEVFPKAHKDSLRISEFSENTLQNQNNKNSISIDDSLVSFAETERTGLPESNENEDLSSDINNEDFLSLQVPSVITSRFTSARPSINGSQTNLSNLRSTSLNLDLDLDKTEILTGPQSMIDKNVQTEKVEDGRGKTQIISEIGYLLIGEDESEGSNDEPPIPRPRSGLVKQDSIDEKLYFWGG